MTNWLKDPAEREAYLALTLVPGIGAATLAKLLAERGRPSAVPEPRADWALAARILAALADTGSHFLLPGDPAWPPMLVGIPEPPPSLFAQGRLELLQQPAVAIVGSRDHSGYGAQVCRSLARAAAGAGLVVVSGMARGLDALAHWGALDAPGGTIGVLGNGFGVIYPPANRILYQAVRERGLLLTEFPPGERPLKPYFPRRNRLISGLARVTVVVEAAAQSGTLNTVECAHHQGREVMAVPGPITSVVSAGTNGLLRDGAGPLLDLADLLLHYPELRAQAVPGRPPGAGALGLERRILTALQVEPLPAERLIEVTRAPVAELLDALAQLELAGAVRLGGGGRYRIAGEVFAVTSNR